jgi:hypothetical protein
VSGDHHTDMRARSTRCSNWCWRAPNRYNGSDGGDGRGVCGRDGRNGRAGRRLCLCEQYVRVTEGRH